MGYSKNSNQNWSSQNLIIRCTLIWQVLDLLSIVIKIVCQVLVICHSIVLTSKPSHITTTIKTLLDGESVVAVVWEWYSEAIHYLLMSKVGNHALEVRDFLHRNQIQKCSLWILTGSHICGKGNSFRPLLTLERLQTPTESFPSNHLASQNLWVMFAKRSYGRGQSCVVFASIPGFVWVTLEAVETTSWSGGDWRLGRFSFVEPLAAPTTW